MSVYELDKLMSQARRLAADYRRATGRTLAISGEIARADAIALLALEPAPPEADGYDAVRIANGSAEKLQIKARAVFGEQRGPHRLGQLKLEQPWDTTLLVLMDEDYQPTAIFEATRSAIIAALEGSRANKRGSLSVGRFKMIGRCLWSRDGRQSAG